MGLRPVLAVLAILAMPGRKAGEWLRAGPSLAYEPLPFENLGTT